MTYSSNKISGEWGQAERDEMLDGQAKSWIDRQEPKRSK